jgi:transposase
MLSAQYLKELAKSEKDPRLKMRYLALYHFKLGVNRTQIAKFIGVNRGSVNTWVSNYLSQGLIGLKSKVSTGRPPKLSKEQQLKVSEYVLTNAVKHDGGRMIAEDVKVYIQENFNVEYTLRNIYWLLHNSGFSWITSRSKHPKQSQEAQDAFKNLPTGNDPSHPV